MVHRKKVFANPSAPRRQQGTRRRATHGSPAKLHLEKLEDRLLMNADNNLPTPVAAADSITVQSAPLVQFTPARSNVQLADAIDFDAFAWNYWRYRPTPIAQPPSIELPQEGFGSPEEAQAWIAQAAEAKYGNLFGTFHPHQAVPTIERFYPFNFDLPLIFQANFSVANTGIFASAVADNAFSETNVQVEGVDEADLVETDGKYLYVISANELIIVDATDGANLSIASRLRLQSRPDGMYLSGDRLTLVSAAGAKTTVTVLDLSDRAAPALVQKTEMDGRLVSSRMVEGELRLVLEQPRHRSLPSTLPVLQSRYFVDPESGEAGYRYESRDDYLTRMDRDVISRAYSGYRSFSVNGEILDRGWFSSPSESTQSGSHFANRRIMIATFDIQSDATGPTATKSVLTSTAATIYATQDSLYVLAGSQSRSSYADTSTSIWKFDFLGEDHSIKLSAKGTIQGRLLNQFSIDEHEGFLRVVVSNGSRWRPSGQSLLVLEQAGRKLNVVGKVEGLAPGERLHSVRFMGDRAFVVTFQKVDPLFAIDLSDPTNPQVAGELKIPGYSDYLQPLDENHLLGIGRGADARIGLFQEFQVSIFDVSDLDNPQLAHRYSFEGGRSTASITTGGRWTQGDIDHHAVSYFSSSDILAIPIHSEISGLTNRAGVNNTPQFARGEGGLQVFSVDVEAGFEPLALIEHDSRILRSLSIGHQLLAISAGEVTVHQMDNPANQIGELELRVGSDIGLVELQAYRSAETLAGYQGIAARVDGVLSGDLAGLDVETDAALQRVAVQEFFSLGSSVHQAQAVSKVTQVSDLAFADYSSRHLSQNALGEEMAEALAADLSEAFAEFDA